jgi:phosphatidylserine decarboxylase
MGDGKLFISALEFVPKKGLSRTVRRLTQVRSQMAVRRFAARYGINLDEAEKPIEDYPTILDLFTRRLKAGLRPLDSDSASLLSPVDGTIEARGQIDSGCLLQAKGRSYKLSALLADEDLAVHFEGGLYATLYLSPKDYHRIHSPISADIIGYTYIPGELYPVNPAAVLHVDSLFAVNERLVTHLESERFGRMALVMVGATNVGHMRVMYDDSVQTNMGAKEIVRKSYAPAKTIERGDELGVFEMGSTVILIMESKLSLSEFSLGEAIRMGQSLGRTSVA